VEINFSEKTARVIVEKGKFDEAAAKSALQAKGFGGERLP
jgi:hypothetical protein